jgi:hypothetical protein
MTTHPTSSTPPTLAQVLRDEAKHLAALMDRQPWQASLALAFLRMAERLDHYTPPAALEAPARDAGREGHILLPCTICGQPVLSPESPATPTEPPPAERDAVLEDSQRIVKNFERLIKPTEPPPPAWDARRLTLDTVMLQAKQVASELMVIAEDGNTSKPGKYYLLVERLFHEFKAAYTAGQRAALGMPEEMPAVLPDLMERYAPANSGIDPQAFWAALRAHLTQTREG